MIHYRSCVSNQGDQRNCEDIWSIIFPQSDQPNSTVLKVPLVYHWNLLFVREIVHQQYFFIEYSFQNIHSFPQSSINDSLVACVPIEDKQKIIIRKKKKLVSALSCVHFIVPKPLQPTTTEKHFYSSTLLLVMKMFLGTRETKNSKQIRMTAC